MIDTMETGKTIKRKENFKYILILEGAVCGILAGFAVSLFRIAIGSLETLRTHVTSDGFSLSYILLYIVLFVVTFLCLHKEKNCSGSGIPHIKGELEGRLDTVWYKVLISKLIGGACAIGAGLSVGREGPSVQIGSMTAKGFSKVTKRLRMEERILMTAGAGAGLSAAFNAPLAGVVFSLEEIHKNLSAELMVTSMASCVCSDFVSSYIFGLSPVFSVIPDNSFPLLSYWLLIIFGLILGVFGSIYNLTIKAVQKAYSLIPSKMVRLAVPFILAAVLAAFYPEVLGGGSPLVDMISKGNPVLKMLVVLLIAKFVFSMISFGSGSPGGIFLPLLVLGALTGSIFAEATGNTVYIDNFIIFGMAGYFTAIVRSPITGIILISEMTGSLSHLLPLALVCLISYVTSDLLKTRPIYDQLLDAMTSVKPAAKDKKIMIESLVAQGSYMDGRAISEIGMPQGNLIVAVNRNGTEIVPSGNTVLHGGDTLLVLLNESGIQEIKKILLEKCETAEEFISATHKEHI